MSVLEKYFDTGIDQRSPVQVDYERKVNYDEDGNEFITYELVDYPKIQAANGSVKDWSLNALLKAGINPNFPIRTGINTRLEGIDLVISFEDEADEILAEMNEPANGE